MTGAKKISQVETNYSPGIGEAKFSGADLNKPLGRVSQGLLQGSIVMVHMIDSYELLFKFKLCTMH